MFMSNDIHENYIWKSVRLERLPWAKDKRRTMVAMFWITYNLLLEAMARKEVIDWMQIHCIANWECKENPLGWKEPWFKCLSLWRCVWQYARGNNGKDEMLLLCREVSVKFVVAIIEEVRNQWCTWCSIVNTLCTNMLVGLQLCMPSIHDRIMVHRGGT